MFVPNLSEAAAMRLIETILFGRPLKAPAPVAAMRRHPRRAPRALSPAINPFEASNAEFFRNIVLRKRVVKTSCPPVTFATPAFVPASSGIARPFSPSGPSFPRGLCYLVGVAPCDRSAAMLTLGLYPLVQLLLNSWLFHPA